LSFNINIINISRFQYKDVTYVSKQLSLAVNYSLDSAVRDPVLVISKLLNDVTWMFYVYN